MSVIHVQYMLLLFFLNWCLHSKGEMGNMYGQFVPTSVRNLCLKWKCYQIYWICVIVWGFKPSKTKTMFWMQAEAPTSWPINRACHHLLLRRHKLKCYSSIFLFHFLLFRVSSSTYHLESLRSLPLKKKKKLAKKWGDKDALEVSFRGVSLT